jgi:hypothetical protein
MSSGWGCVHLTNQNHCVLLNKPCVAGQAGCVLYGKVVFSNPENPSNKAIDRKEERERQKEEEEFNPHAF